MNKIADKQIYCKVKVYYIFKYQIYKFCYIVCMITKIHYKIKQQN